MTLDSTILNWIYMSLHGFSLVGALLTFVFLSREHRLERSDSARLRLNLLQLWCANTLFVSFMILLPALFQQQQQRLSASCWLQGLSLHYAFLVQHLLTLVLAVQTWLRVVRRDLSREYVWSRYYLRCIYGLPFLATLLGFVVSLALNGGSLESSLVGVQPGPIYCFLDRPVWLHFFLTYTLWYTLATVLGTLLSVWTVTYLIQLKQEQKKLFHSSRISSSILYRTALFALMQSLGAGLSYMPSLLWQIAHLILEWQQRLPSHDTSEAFSRVEFSQSLSGIFIFVLFFRVHVLTSPTWKPLSGKSFLKTFPTALQRRDSKRSVVMEMVMERPTFAVLAPER